MLVEITEIKISEDRISIMATNLENIIMAEDLFEDFEDAPVEFVFDRHGRNNSAMKYLYKVCQGQKKCRSAKTMGEKLEKLTGVITTLSDGFKAKA